jgi:uncharacterized protein YjbJ (UPF0337 family)
MDHNTIRTNRANLVVPDSKARTKIARDRNASGNGASAKNKAMAANKAVINKEATSKADDKSGFIRVFGQRGQLPPFASPCRSPSVANQFTTAAFIAGDFVLMKSSTKDKIKGGFEEAKGKVKEKAGKATGDPDLRDRGTAEKAGGKVRRKIGDLKKVFEQ